MILALDTETYRIEAGALFPKIVCCSIAYRSGEHLVSELLGNDDLEAMEASFHSFLTDEHQLVFANAGFDLGVICSNFPSLIPVVFEALADGRIHDVQIRQKLINLGTHGKLDDFKLPDGSTKHISFSLASLVQDYLGKDRSDQKKAESSVRLDFEFLDGKAAGDYPEEFYAYAVEDAEDTLRIYELQEGKPNLETEWLHAGADFALKLMSAWGMPVDQEAVAEIREQVEQLPNSGIYEPLYRSGIIQAALPPQPYANGAVDKKTGEPKMKAEVPEKVKKAMLQMEVFRVCKEKGIDIKLAPKGREALDEKYASPATMERLIGENNKALGYISTDKKFLPDLEPHSELIELYALRQKFQKLLTSVLPVVEGVERIYPSYDVLKETGRTSSYGSKLVPSLNIQQQGDFYSAKLPNGEEIQINARRMFAPAPGRIFAAADYSALELCSAAQQCYSQLEHSDLREVINSGKDAHSHLGAQLAHRFHPEFRELCDEAGLSERDEIYNYFLKAKSHESEEVRKFFKEWRTLAKPTGLGFWGGLGPETMVTYAWDTYGVRMTKDEAKQFRDFWYSYLRETRPYFNWINGQVDDKNPVVGKDENGKPITGYKYTTPLGMTRRGARFCAAANGKAMQSPSAEGAKIALFELARECYDPTMESVLYGARPCAFIHDEILMEIEDDDRAHDRAVRLSEIMEESMSLVMPDVKITAEPLLMRRWSKAADPVFEGGRLIPWDFAPAEREAVAV